MSGLGWGGIQTKSIEACEKLAVAAQILGTQIGHEEATQWLTLFHVSLGMVFISRACVSGLLIFLSIVPELRCSRLMTDVIQLAEFAVAVAATLAFIVLLDKIPGATDSLSPWTWLTLILLQLASSFTNSLLIALRYTGARKENHKAAQQQEFDATERRVIQNAAVGVVLLILNVSHRAELQVAAAVLLLVATHSSAYAPMAFALKLLAETMSCVVIFQQTTAMPEWFVRGATFTDSPWWPLLTLFWILAVWQVLVGLIVFGCTVFDVPTYQTMLPWQLLLFFSALILFLI
jgi:hypothetical protein